MKHTFSRLLLCAVIVLIGSVSAYVNAQSSSTEGREFWIALTKAKTTGSGGYTPYITISAKKACHIEIKNPNTTWSGVSKDIPAGLTEIGTNEIPLVQWTNTSFNTSDFQVEQNLGLQLTSTENVSVYVASRMEFSFDATNVLPITALTTDYMIQDYPACDHEDKADQNSATFVVVATEDNTEITIVPTVDTRNGNAAGSTIKYIIPKKGQVYHVISVDKKGSSFTGTTVQANKPIALFAGDVNTDVPGEASARDLLYEQQMPTAFWGTEFVVTRSMERDADRVRITALNDNTDVMIDGQKCKILNSGETFEIELGEGDIDQSAMNKMFTNYDLLISGTDAHYIQTSCPVAVYLYIVSQKYKRKDATYDNGDPSMVWISPIEQQIKEITFGIFATDKTTDHYVNIVTETSNVSSMKLLNMNGANLLTEADFQPVLANPGYSYARKLVYQSQTSNPKGQSFTIKGRRGFIAHVYGNGEKESYAYSVGSSTVERSIEIDGNKLGNGDSLTICLGQPIEFATNFNSYDVDQITWDLGDGITKTFYSDEVYNYTYETKGWYDIIVTFSLTGICTKEVVAGESLAVKLYVNIPDTSRTNKFLCEGESFNGVTYTTAGQYIDTVYYDCDSVVILNVLVGKPSNESIQLTAFDSVFVQGDENNPDTYVYDDAILQRKYKNITGCDSIVELNIHVVHCTDMTISYNNTLCGGDTLAISYILNKGAMPLQGKFVAGDYTYNIRISQVETNSGYIYVAGIRPGRYLDAKLQLQDPQCGLTYEIDVPLTINFPSTIIAQKWNNVLAVYNAKKNGGYEFLDEPFGYQWYKNNEELEGENKSIYYVGSDYELDFNSYYWVMLTTVDGLQLPSCPFYPKDKYADEEEIDEEGLLSYEILNVAVSPTIVNAGENLFIDAELNGKAKLFDVAGLSQTETEIGRYTIMQAPAKAGVYIMHITLEDSSVRTFRIIVK